MSRYLTWTERDIAGLRKTWGLSRIFTEIDAQGAVSREIGLNESGDVVHRYPGLPSRAEYGVFDTAKIAHPIQMILTYGNLTGSGPRRSAIRSPEHVHASWSSDGFLSPNSALEEGRALRPLAKPLCKLATPSPMKIDHVLSKAGRGSACL